MPAGIGLEVVLDLSHVALEPGAHRELPCHLLPEELRRVGLGTVDARRAAYDDRANRVGLLAGREQLERADDVDVVHGLGGDPGTGAADDLVVHDGVHFGRRDQPGDHRVSDVRIDQLGALQGHLWPASVEAGHVLELRVALQTPRERPAEVAAHAGDQDTATRHYAGLRFAGRRFSIASSLRPIARSSALSSRMSSCVAGRRSSMAPVTARRLPRTRSSTVSTTSAAAPCARSRVRSAEPTVAWTVRSTASRTASGSSLGVVRRRAIGPRSLPYGRVHRARAPLEDPPHDPPRADLRAR